MIKKTLTLASLALLVLLAGCASELETDRDIHEMKRLADSKGDPLKIQEANNLESDTSKSVYGEEGNDDSAAPPAFTYDKGTGKVVNAQPGEIERPARGVGSVTLNFENADLREVVKFIMTDILSLNYIVAPNVQGRVTLQTSEPLAKEDLLPTLETLLKLNGAVLLQDGDLMKVMLQAEANRGNLVPQVGRIKRLKPGYEVRIIPLKYLSAQEAQKTLEPFLPPGSLVQVDVARNIFTVAGSSQELANIQQTIDTFDVDWLKGMSIGMYRLQNVGVSEVMPELEGLFGASGSTPFAGLFNFIPIDRTNSVMVITSQPNYLIEAKRWLERLDQNEGADTERLYVYRVQNGRAEDLASVLSGVFNSSATVTKTESRDRQVSPGNTGASVSSNQDKTKAKTKTTQVTAKKANTGKGTSVSGAQANIVADEVNNSLLIKATPANYDLVLQALRQIDVAKLQVLLDVVIAEINLTDELSYGLGFWLDDAKGGRETSTKVSSDGGFNYSLISGTIDVEVEALVKKGLAKFLSTPSLMVLDNETATMSVGDQISVTGDAITTGDTVTKSESYLQTGVDLEVTPRVNAGGMVTLDITQKVSRPGTREKGVNPDIFDRQISTSISARDGQTIVLGGLIQEENNSDRAGLPILSDIPVIGALFRGTTRDTKRTELIVMVTPRVSRNSNDSLDITKEFKERMQGLKVFSK